MSAPAFTPGPWTAHPHDGRAFYIHAAHMLAPRVAIVSYSDGAHSYHEANARLIAAAPELYEAAAKHLEWIEKEHQGPQYGELTRDTHPLGEQIWSQWWNEQLDLCAATERLCRAALAKARGESA